MQLPALTEYYDPMFSALMISALSLFAAPNTPEPAISEPVMYHGDEWNAQPGAGWLALQATDQGFHLVETYVQVTRVEDVILDEPGQKTGKDITCDLSVPPMFLLGHHPSLKPGPVTTFQATNQWLKPGESIPLDKHRFEVYATATPDENHPEDNFLEYAVVMQSESTTQILVDGMYVATDGMPSLLWAGDLDRDNKPDLILDVTNHYNVRHLVLYLSTSAEKGELVGLVAELRTTGC